jgi:two-component system sensor histidine kinase YesM
MKGIKYIIHSIRGKLIITFIILIVVPILLIFLSYTYSSKSLLEKEVYATNQELVESKAKGIDDLVGKMVKATAFVESDVNQSDISKLSDWKNDYQAYSVIKKVQTSMGTIRDLLLDSRAYLIYLDNNQLAISTLYDFNMDKSYTNLIKEPWYIAANKQMWYPIWSLLYKLNPEFGYTDAGMASSFVTISRTVRDATGSRSAGVISVGVPWEVFFGKRDSSPQGLPDMMMRDHEGRFMDPKGNAFTGFTEEQLSELNGASDQVMRFNHEGNTYLVNEAKVSLLGVSLLTFIPNDQFTAQLNKSQTKSILIILLFFAAAILLFIYFMLRYTKPIYSLLHSMGLVGTGDFKAVVHVKGRDEISLLGNSFNRMTYKLQELMAHVVDEQRKKEEAHFQALQAQINPHFLFNTLNSIKLMAMLSNTNRNVSDMITALGKLLEFSMKLQHHYVTLRQELEYLELYMYLQKIRYNDNISIAMDVPEDLMDSYVLKFSLQPLVENSLIHGGRLPLHIQISAHWQPDQLGYTISIQDNGKGVSAEELVRIQEGVTPSHAKYSGIGIGNVDQRMKLYFGAAYGITLHQIEEGGLEARIQLPYIQKEPTL